MLVAALLAAVVAVVAVSYELLEGGGERGRRSITEHAGTLHWTPRGSDPAPELGARYWTWAYPAAYAPRVQPGVGVYVNERRIGEVRAKRIDRGSVWVYAWIAPEYQRLAAASRESEPIETADGPRIEIYRWSFSTPPPQTTPA